MPEENRESLSYKPKKRARLGMWIACGLAVYVGSYFLLLALSSMLFPPGADVELESGFILLMSILDLFYLPLTLLLGLLG